MAVQSSPEDAGKHVWVTLWKLQNKWSVNQKRAGAFSCTKTACDYNGGSQQAEVACPDVLLSFNVYVLRVLIAKKTWVFFVSGVTYMSVSAVQEVLCQGECGISWSLLALWPYLNSLSSPQTKINWMPLDIQWKLVLQWPCRLPLTRAGRIVLLHFYRHSFSSSCWKLILSHGEGTCSCAGGGAIVFSTFGGLTSK